MARRFASYAEVLGALFAARRFGVKLDLGAIRGVLAALGHPEASLGVIAHIGGTNGKGSTAAMLAALARSCGLRVALYTSPHLVTLRERIVVQGELIDEAQLLAALNAVYAAGGEALTFFEQVTAAAMWHFARSAPDLTVLEVGLGGRGDATSVIAPHAAVSAVTGVAMDHVGQLGDTLEKIAWEKAGIFARGGVAVIGISGEVAAQASLRRFAQEAGAARVVQVGPAALAGLPATLALPGAHQRLNAACAVAMAEVLAAGPSPALAAARDPSGIWTALGDAAWVVHPGRYERCAWRGTSFILDGAHNPDGAAALAAALHADAALAGVSPRVVVFAASADKDVMAMVRPLRAWATHLIAATFANERAAAAAAIAAAASTQLQAANMQAALEQASLLAGRDGVVVVAGSLMAVGEARACLLALPGDPIATSDPMACPR